MPATLRLYLADKIDQWWIRQTQTGSVFLLNVTSLEEARALMDQLPLAQAGLMQHEFIELGPLTPLHLLLNDGGARNEIMTIGYERRLVIGDSIEPID